MKLPMMEAREQRARKTVELYCEKQLYRQRKFKHVLYHVLVNFKRASCNPLVTRSY